MAAEIASTVNDVVIVPEKGLFSYIGSILCVSLSQKDARFRRSRSSGSLVEDKSHQSIHSGHGRSLRHSHVRRLVEPKNIRKRIYIALGLEERCNEVRAVLKHRAVFQNALSEHLLPRFNHQDIYKGGTVLILRKRLVPLIHLYDSALLCIQPLGE